MSGVIDVREILSTQRNLYVEAIATSTNDLTAITNALTAEGLKTRSAAGSWRREIVARRGDGLLLVVERDRGRSTSVEARIRVRGETAAFGRLGPGDLRDRLSLRARAD